MLFIKTFLLVQEYLKEEPYTAEEIEAVTGEKLTSFLNINSSYLDVIKAAKQYKLHQVRIKAPLVKFFMYEYDNISLSGTTIVKYMKCSCSFCVPSLPNYFHWL